MAEIETESGLKIVDAFDLDPGLRALLRPGELVEGIGGQYHHLPRYFYEIPSHDAAREIRLTPHFGLNEFLLVDLKEAPRIRAFPRYVPCAIRLVAFYLERLRDAVSAPVHLAVNGGYRSPAHKLSVAATPHMWGTAADLYKIGTVRYGARELAHVVSLSVDQVRHALEALEKKTGVAQRAVEINRLENEADRIHEESLRRLFDEEHDPVMIIKWKEILDFLEEATDRCEDVANLMEGVVVKNA